MQRNSRFNLLLTQDRPHTGEQHHWTHQLPRLLEPHGVEAFLASTGRDAIDLAERQPIHAAVVDLGTPVGDEQQPRQQSAEGLWLLELIRRLPNRPPVVLLRKPATSRTQADRLLREALRLGVFTVMNKPVQLEQLLTVFQRLMDKRYQGAWPGNPQAADPADDSFSSPT